MAPWSRVASEGAAAGTVWEKRIACFIVVLALGYGQWCGVLQLYCVRVCEGVYAGSVTNGNGVACCVPPRPILQPHMRLNYYTLCLFNYCID